MTPAKQQLKDAILRSGLSKRDWYRKVYSRSLHWSNLREMAFLKHGKRCQKCGCGGILDVHHLNYRNIFDVTVDDLQPICRRCHNIEHGKPGGSRRVGKNGKKLRSKKCNPASEQIADDRIPAHVLEFVNSKIRLLSEERSKHVRNKAINLTISKFKIRGIVKMILKSKKTGAKGRRIRKQLEQIESVKSI